MGSFATVGPARCADFRSASCAGALSSKKRAAPACLRATNRDCFAIARSTTSSQLPRAARRPTWPASTPARPCHWFLPYDILAEGELPCRRHRQRRGLPLVLLQEGGGGPLPHQCGRPVQLQRPGLRRRVESSHHLPLRRVSMYALLWLLSLVVPWLTSSQVGSCLFRMLVVVQPFPTIFSMLVVYVRPPLVGLQAQLHALLGASGHSHPAGWMDLSRAGHAQAVSAPGTVPCKPDQLLIIAMQQACICNACGTQQLLLRQEALLTPFMATETPSP